MILFKRSLLFFMMIGILSCSADKADSVTVSGVSWDCSRRPCHVVYELKNTASHPVQVEIEVTGFSINHPQGPHPEPFISGKRQFHYTLQAGEQKTQSEDVKFTRYPEEIKVMAVKESRVD